MSSTTKFLVLAVAAVVVVMATAASCTTPTTDRCRRFTTQAQCAALSKLCTWGCGGRCYNVQLSRCCGANATICDTETQECCSGQNFMPYAPALCCPRDVRTGHASCCAGVYAQCCKANATCCVGGAPGSASCCDGFCPAGICCKQTIKCGGQTCCPGQCNNGMCMPPP